MDVEDILINMGTLEVATFLHGCSLHKICRNHIWLGYKASVLLCIISSDHVLL